MEFSKILFVLAFLLSACDGTFLESEEDADDVTDTGFVRRPARPSAPTGNSSSSDVGVGGSGDDGSGGGTETVGSTSSSSTDSSTSSSSGGEGGQGGSAEPHLRVHLSLEDTPRSQIVLPFQTSGQAYAFATYDVTNESDEDVVITRIQIDQVNWNGDIADFGAVNVTMGQVAGMWLHSDGWRIAPGEIDSRAHFTEGPLDFDTTAAVTSFTVPAQQTQKVRIAAYMSQICSGSSVDGSWHGYARSGHTPALEIVSVETNAGSVYMDEHGTSPMVLRKSVPTITQQALTTNTLADGDQELIKFKVATGTYGPIAMKKLGIGFGKTGAFSLSDLRVRRGAIDLPISSYNLEIATPNDTGSIIEPDMGFGNINIIFTDEEVISGSGYVYTLHAEVSGVESGDTFSMTLGTGLSWDPATACVSDIMPNGFVWSDMSEVPHSALSCQQGGSLDWTHETLVPGIGFSEALSL